MSYQYVSEYRDRHGKVRTRFRRNGVSVPLPPLDTMDFHEAYAACLKDAKAMALIAKPVQQHLPLVSQARQFMERNGLPKEGEYIYFVLSSARRIKIGFTKAPLKRFGSLTTNCPDKLSLLAIVPGSTLDERAWHYRFSGARVGGEWFRSSEEMKAAIRAAKVRTLVNIV